MSMYNYDVIWSDVIEIKSSDCEKLLRMKIDLPLNFEEYFNVLSRVTLYMSLYRK